MTASIWIHIILSYFISTYVIYCHILCAWHVRSCSLNVHIFLYFWSTSKCSSKVGEPSIGFAPQSSVGSGNWSLIASSCRDTNHRAFCWFLMDCKQCFEMLKSWRGSDSLMHVRWVQSEWFGRVLLCFSWRFSARKCCHYLLPDSDIFDQSPCQVCLIAQEQKMRTGYQRPLSRRTLTVASSLIWSQTLRAWIFRKRVDRVDW